MAVGSYLAHSWLASLLLGVAFSMYQLHGSSYQGKPVQVHFSLQGTLLSNKNTLMEESKISGEPDVT